MNSGAALRRLLLCWTLWGTVWGDEPEVWPERWKDLGTYASQATCTQAAWQEQAQRPVLASEQLEEASGRVLSVLQWSREFRCQPCAAAPP